MPSKRGIIAIDESKCDGCGLCVDACHEGAIELVGDKARLVSDSYCDGLGDCLGECPQGAISIIEREAEAFDGGNPSVASVQPPAVSAPPMPAASLGHGLQGCPGAAVRALVAPSSPPAHDADDQPPPSLLGHWPVQLMLVPPQAPFLRGADLLVCADCVPFVVSDFHARYLRGRAVVVGCPKLDDLAHYEAKLAQIMIQARPSRLTVARLSVPCCRGIAGAAIRAAETSGSGAPVVEHVVTPDGAITRRQVRTDDDPFRDSESQAADSDEGSRRRAPPRIGTG